MAKKYSPAQAKEIIEKSKNIQLDTQDERMDNLSLGIPFERTKTKYDVLQTLATGVHSKATIEFGGFEFNFRLLSMQEIMDLEIEARNFMIKQNIVIPYHEDYIKGLYTLERALTSCPEAKDGILNFNDLKALDLNFFLGLMDEYRAFVAKCDIKLDDMTDQQFAEVIDLVEKKQLLLKDLPHRLLVKVGNFLLGCLLNLTQPMDNIPTQS